MRRRAACLMTLLGLLASAAPAWAGVCSLDDRPGATLLLPYFEVDLASPAGRTTLFTINNAAAEPVLVNVVLWTDMGVPTLNFPVYLTGYDVQTVNLRDLFDGRVPQTASDAQDPQDAISPQGMLSQDIGFPSCDGLLPPLAQLPDWLLAHLRLVHTGNVSPIWRMCAGQYLNDDVARGYVTMDTASRCAFLFPSDPGYFGPGGLATSQNVLWGDFFYVDPANAFAQGENLIRLQADPVALAGKRTFYGRYVNGSGADGREPLPSIWAVRYLSAGTFSGGTDLVAWRDSGRVNKPFPCHQPPTPLVLKEYVPFDEEENPFVPVPLPIDPPLPLPPLDYLPAEANRFTVGQEHLRTPFDFGWIYVDLGLFPSGIFDPSQGWVGVVMKANGRFSAGLGATPLASGCRPEDRPFPRPE
ncbi:MAG TPA: hypothetical protein VGG03_00535 [Thermoanaerobaculia bacterium]|jgi:hypothetical protein